VTGFPTEYLGRVRLTRPGAVLIAILVGLGVVFAVTAGWPRALAGLVGLLILLALAGEGLGGTGYGGDARRKQEVLRRQARPRQVPPAEEPPEQPVSGLVSRRRRDPG
jgi:hypothetical protein